LTLPRFCQQKVELGERKLTIAGQTIDLCFEKGPIAL
jgi:hypothetical protein